MAETAVAFFAALVIHELGHLLAAHFLHVPVTAVDFSWTGIEITFDFSHSTYLTELLVHFSGPIFGILSAVALYWLFPHSAGVFVLVSVSFSLLNLLPIRGFDGGGILRSLLHIFVFPDTAFKWCAAVSDITLIFMWTGVLWVVLRAGANFGLLVFSLVILSKLSDNKI